jgi:hypothetical protein
MNEETEPELLDLLSRIAVALEVIAKVQDPKFEPPGTHPGSGIKPKR